MSKNPVPNKYPYVLIIRKGEYASINKKLDDLKDKLEFSFKIVKYSDDEDFQTPHDKVIRELNCLFSEEFNVLITVGKNWNEYNISPYLIPKMNSKWIHLTEEEICIPEIVNNRVLHCYINNLPERKKFRPKISCFTTGFHSFEKIYRPFKSLLIQTFKDWEWIIVDDSKDDKNFSFIRENISSKDHRIRAYRKDFHSGNIGNVKNEAVSLCRGEYVLELDHDDEILPDTLEQIVKGFDEYPEVGFVYMNFSECYEDMRPFTYGKDWGMGYGGYHTEEYKGYKFEVAESCDINDRTMSNIVGVPNHPRAWRKNVLVDVLGNYSEAMPIADDYELLVLTALKTKMLKINKFGYIQYKNNSNNNFSLIRNREITKLQHWVSNIYYTKYNVKQFFKEQGVSESEKKEFNHINLIKY